MLKRPSTLLRCNNVRSSHPTSKLKTSLHVAQSRQRPQHRSYAIVSDGSSRHNHGHLRWPEVQSANAIPTPYQIFNQKKGSPYSKQRYYELVKLYHPDRHDFESSATGLSYSTKVERYRLVVAANDVLSDPIRRSAFDRYGAGWNGMPDVHRRDKSSDPSTSWGTGHAGGWSEPDGPSRNATWEDWEKWHARNAKGPQQPQFVSNTAFAGLVVLFAILGGIGQATRVGNFTMNSIEQRDALHNTCSKDLMRRRRDATTRFGSKEERIEAFLRQREPIRYELASPKQERPIKMLPAPENG